MSLVQHPIAGMHQFIIPGDVLRAEVEANARRGRITPEVLLRQAVSNFARIYAE